MRYLVPAVVAVCFASVLGAQLRHTVAYPDTLLVYAEADTRDLPLKKLSNIIDEVSEGQTEIPDLGSIARDGLDLDLTDEEAKALATGTTHISAGLLDWTLKGPKLQIVVETGDTAPLLAALNKAAANENHDYVLSKRDIEGVPVFELFLAALTDDDERSLMQVFFNPFTAFLTQTDFWLGIHENKVILTTSLAAMDDATFGLLFPDDPEETLKGSQNFNASVKPYLGADMVVYVNVRSVIRTVERVTGDQGTGGVVENFGGDDPELGRFIGECVEYRELDRAAGGVWYDPDARTLRAKGSLNFTNAPGWYEAIRFDSAKDPYRDWAPVDAMFYVSTPLPSFGDKYRNVRKWFTDRAKAAGQDQLIEAWDEGIADMLDGDKLPDQSVVSLEEYLNLHANGAAFVMMNSSTEPPLKGMDMERWRDSNPTTAGLIGLKDADEAKEIFFNYMHPEAVGRQYDEKKEEELLMTTAHGIDVFHGSMNADGIAFAFVETADQSFLLIGEFEAVVRIINAKHSGKTLATNPMMKQAQALANDTNAIVAVTSMRGFWNMVGAQMEDFGSWDDEPSDASIDETDNDSIITQATGRLLGDMTMYQALHLHEKSIEIEYVMVDLPTDERIDQYVSAIQSVNHATKLAKSLKQIRRDTITHRALEDKMPTALDSVTDDITLIVLPDDCDLRAGIAVAYSKETVVNGEYLVTYLNGDVLFRTKSELDDDIARAKKGQPSGDARRVTPLVEKLKSKKE